MSAVKKELQSRQLTTLGNLFKFKGGGTPSKKNPNYWGGNIPWASVKDIKNQYLTTTIDTITQAGLDESAANLANPGDLILLTRIEPGKVAIVKKSIAVNQDCKIATPKENVDLVWSYYLFRSLENEFIKQSSGTTVLGIRLNDVKEIPVILPLFKEQKRISAKIEELFSELDKGIESLKTAREQLKIYRQALLKHAFEGKLTEQWRKENADAAQGCASVAGGQEPGATKLKTPEQLLARIQKEREARYQQQLEEWKQAVKEWESNGKEGKKPSKPSRPAGARTGIEYDLYVPEEWVVLELEALAYESVLGKMLDKQKNTGKDRPYLGNINVRWGAFSLEQLKSMRIEDAEAERYSLKKGDLVVCEGGEPGRCAVWEGEDDAIFIQKALHRIRFTESYRAKFAFYYLVYSVPLERVINHFTGTTIKHLTGAGLNRVQFPLCSLAEQDEVIQRLEEKLSQVEAMESTINAQEIKSETLRQAILKKAFSDQLVNYNENIFGV